MKTVPCVLCGVNKRLPLVTGYDRMQPRAEDYRYERCAACGLVALAPLPSPEEVEGFYPADYYARIDTWRRNLDKPINRLAIRYLFSVDSRDRSRLLRGLLRVGSSRILKGIHEPHGANRMLDVGCGTGDELETYRRLGWSVQGIETNPQACAVCRGRGLEVHEATVFAAPLAGQTFDLILLNHVIEHVLDPVAVVARVAGWLAPNGRLIVRTPNIDSLGFALYGASWYSLDAPRHIFLFDPYTIRVLARRAAVTVRRLVTQASPRVLLASRHYARTQGRVLRGDPASRETILREARAPAQRIARELLMPLAALSVVWQRGEHIEAEFVKG